MPSLAPPSSRNLTSRASSVFHDHEFYVPKSKAYELLPFRFEKLDRDQYVAVNEVGEWQTLNRSQLEVFVKKQLSQDSALYRALKSKHFLVDEDSSVAVDLLILKYRSKHHRVSEFTSLHMFVVTLRCNHSCQYCQVSRQSEDRSAFDMTPEMADKAIDFTFRSPSRNIKIEFQGGEPLLNFDLIKYITLQVKERNQQAGKNLEFVIATNLSVLNDDILLFCREHKILISTSLDGPEDLHNMNRPKMGNDSLPSDH